MENDRITQESAGVPGLSPEEAVRDRPADGETGAARAVTDAPARQDAVQRGGDAAGEGSRPRPAAGEAAFRAVLAEAEALRSRYPGFDLGRELADPRFAGLLVGLQRAGAPDPVRLAFEGVHHGELTRAAVRAAVERTAAGLAEAVRSAASRPAENGGGSAAGARVDPAALSPRQRRDIRERVMRGERVVF